MQTLADKIGLTKTLLGSFDPETVNKIISYSAFKMDTGNHSYIFEEWFLDNYFSFDLSCIDSSGMTK